MSVYLIESAMLKGIADAIREKTGGTESILTENMASEIRGISGGSTGGVNKLAQVVDRTVTEITEEDLQGVTNIGAYAFRNCSSLSNVELPTSIKSIGSYAFASCKALEEIVLPNGVETIGGSVFDNCTSVKTIDLPESLLNIEGGPMVSACMALEKIIVRATTPPTIQNTTLNNFWSNSIKIIVPYGCGKTYKNATNWSARADQIVEEEGGSGDTEVDWLFQNEQIDGGREVLDENGNPIVPVEGVSYTLFIDGEEIATSTAEQFSLQFYTEDFRVIFIYNGTWHFHPIDSQVQSGSVSIRINSVND